MNTTTEHLKALLVDDGREFAMVRKKDLRLYLHVLDQRQENDPEDVLGQALYRNAELRERIGKLELDNGQIAKYGETLESHGKKHGEERRRYMANNKALLARNAILEADMEAYQAMYKEDGRKLDLLRHAIRKAPATCRMLGLIK